MGPPQETEPLNLEAGGGLWDGEPGLGGAPRILRIIVIVIAAAIATPSQAYPMGISILLKPHNSLIS